MWFKNLRAYRFSEKMNLSGDVLEEQLGNHAFNPCNKMDFSSLGWVPPMGKEGEMLTHTVGPYSLLCARKQEKIIPAAAVNEMVDEKVSELETEQARDVYRKEKRNIKEEVVHSLLPRALTRSVMTYAFVSKKDDMLFIDAGSQNKAEEFLDQLRASLGRLPVVPLSCHGDITSLMTRWVKTRVPKPFELDAECELQNPLESKNLVRCRNQELKSDEVMEHINAGKKVIQLGLIWRDSIRFVLADDFSVRRLRFEDSVKEAAETDADDRAAQFDQDFAVMSLQLSEMVNDLLEAAGGIEKSN